MVNPFDIFRRAQLHLPLTPTERAWLKLVKGFGMAALIAGLLAASQALAGTGPVDWQRVAYVAGVSALVALLNAIAKYASAQGDVSLGAALAALAGEVEQRGGVAGEKQGVHLTAPDASASPAVAGPVPVAAPPA